MDEVAETSIEDLEKTVLFLQAIIVQALDNARYNRARIEKMLTEQHHPAEFANMALGMSQDIEFLCDIAIDANALEELGPEHEEAIGYIRRELERMIHDLVRKQREQIVQAQSQILLPPGVTVH